MIKLGVNGARGRMGQRIIALAKQDKSFEVEFGLEARSHPDIGKTIDGVQIRDDPSCIDACDCVIDFSLPLAIVGLIPYLTKFGKCVVIGTTGLDQTQQEKVRETSKIIPMVFSPNMSVGVNLVFKLLKEAAEILKNYKVDIEEAHHIHKKDVPSGTAKKIAEVINAQGFNIKIDDIKAIREDEIVGDHRVVFESDVDKIELSHSAKTRDVFAKGALVAAKWLSGKSAGLYSMDDVLFGR